MKSQSCRWWKIDHFLLWQMLPGFFLVLPFKAFPVQSRGFSDHLHALRRFPNGEERVSWPWVAGMSGRGGSGEKCPLSKDPSILPCLCWQIKAETINTVDVSWPNSADLWPLLSRRNNGEKRRRTPKAPRILPCRFRPLCSFKEKYTAAGSKIFTKCWNSGVRTHSMRMSMRIDKPWLLLSFLINMLVLPAKRKKTCKDTQLVARIELVLISRADLPRCSLDTCAENQKMQIWEEDPAVDYFRWLHAFLGVSAR